MSDNKDSCGKTICKNTGECIFGIIWDILTCPFITCFKCFKYMCCCRCCKKEQSPQQV